MIVERFTELYTTLQSKIKEDGVKKYSKSMGWMFVARIGSTLITLLATAFIARNLGPTNYGQLSYAISYVSLFSFIAAFGIDQILHRDLVQYPQRKNELLGSAIFARMLASLFCIVIVTFSAITFSSNDVSLILIFIISLSPLFGAFQLLGYEFYADAKSKYPAILSLLVIAILNVLKIVVIAFDEGIIYLSLIVLLEPILYSLGYLYIKQRVYGDALSLLNFKQSTAFAIAKNSFPLIFAGAFYAIYARIDQVMLKHMINEGAVGLYDAAVRISELSYFIPSTILLTLLPAIIQSKMTSEHLYYARMKKLFLLLIGISALIALCVTVFAKYIVLIIYGEGFSGSTIALQIYIWSTLGAALTLLGQQLLINEDAIFHTSIMTFLGMLTNILLNLYLIPLYGIAGAALATLISYLVPFISLFFFKKTSVLMKKIILE